VFEYLKYIEQFRLISSLYLDSH